MVGEFWSKTNFSGWSGFILAEKLKGLMETLKVRNKEIFGNVKENLKDVEDKINELDRLAESSILSEADVARKNKLKKDFWGLSRRLEWIWLQKSRLDWSLKGDRNTKFFHTIANARHNRNMLDSLIINGVCVDDPVLLKSEILLFFKNAFKESWYGRLKLGGEFMASLNAVQGELLTKPFDEVEIWQAVVSCDSNKAPSPDGFNLSFIKTCWKVVKGDFIQVFNDFHANSKLVRGLNSSFITLIPRLANPIGLSDYRPISLIGCVYKVLAKVLAESLKRVLHVLIFEEQSAFVGGRNIQDGILITNEVLDMWRRKKQKGVILKLDFQRAYDNLSWLYLF